MIIFEYLLLWSARTLPFSNLIAVFVNRHHNNQGTKKINLIFIFKRTNSIKLNILSKKLVS
jgi:hypothetical protein